MKVILNILKDYKLNLLVMANNNFNTRSDFKNFINNIW